MRSGISSGDLKNAGLCKQQVIAQPSASECYQSCTGETTKSVSELQGRDLPALPKSGQVEGHSRCFAFPTRAGEVKGVEEVYEVGTGRPWESFGKWFFFMITGLGWINKHKILVCTAAVTSPDHRFVFSTKPSFKNISLKTTWDRTSPVHTNKLHISTPAVCIKKITSFWDCAAAQMYTNMAEKTNPWS